MQGFGQEHYLIFTTYFPITNFKIHSKEVKTIGSNTKQVRHNCNAVTTYGIMMLPSVYESISEHVVYLVDLQPVYKWNGFLKS